MAARTPLALTAVTLLLTSSPAGAQGLRLSPPTAQKFGGVPIVRDPFTDLRPTGLASGSPAIIPGVPPYGCRYPGALTPGAHERAPFQHVPPPYLREPPKYRVPDFKTGFQTPPWLRWLLGGGGVILAHALSVLCEIKEESRT
jgi:hypothetical protein